MHAELRFVPFGFRALCIPDVTQKYIHLLLMVEFGDVHRFKGIGN